MTQRAAIEALLTGLYAARLRGDLEAMMRAFADDSRLDIAGASYTSPMTVKAAGSAQVRKWLALLVKSFQLTDQQVLALIVEDERAAAHWRALVRSRITGIAVPTEFIDVVTVRAGRIALYTEFFVPR